MYIYLALWYQTQTPTLFKSYSNANAPLYSVMTSKLLLFLIVFDSDLTRRAYCQSGIFIFLSMQVWDYFKDLGGRPRISQLALLTKQVTPLFVEQLCLHRVW